MSITEHVEKAAPLLAEHFKMHPRDIDRLTLGEFDALIGLYNRRVHEADDVARSNTTS